MRGLSARLREALQDASEDDAPEDAQEPEEGEGEAQGAPGERERVPLAVGQKVEVRTPEGQLIVGGVIHELSVETGSVRVVDAMSGTDHQVDVDPDLYEVWVMPVAVPGDAGGGRPEKAPAVNPHRRGAYDGGRF